MSNNMTRKGLAFGAGFALVATGLAAMPAQAANESGLTLVPHYGPADNFVTLQGDDHGIVLETEISNIGSNDPSQLKYEFSIIPDANVDNFTDIDGGGVNAFALYSAALADTDGGDELTGGVAATVANPNTSDTTRVITPGDMGVDRVFGITGGAINAIDTSTASAITVTVPGHDIVAGETVTLAGVSDQDGNGNAAGAYTVDAVTGNTVSMSEAANDADIDAAGAATVTLAATISVAGKPSASRENLLYLSVGDQDLTPAAGEEDLSVTVRAWIDQDGDNIIGSNEYASPIRTVTFKAVEDVKINHNVNFLTVGSTSIGGNFSISGINNQNFFTVLKDTTGEGFEVDVDKAGANTDTGDNTDGTNAGDSTLTYKASLDRYEYAFDANAIDVLIDGANDATNAIDAGTYNFKLIAVDNNDGDVEPGDADGAGVFFSGNKSDTNIAVVASTSSLNKMEIVATTSSTAGQNDAGAGNSLIEEAETVELLTGTTSASFTIDLYTAATTRAGSGIEVEVTLNDVTNSLDSTTLTVEGETLSATTAGDAVSFTKKTDSSGRIAFTVTADEGAAGESFTIDAVAGDKSIDTTTVQWADRDFKLVQTPDTNFTIDTEGSVTVEYSVVDQFNQVPSGEYQVAFTRARASGDRTDAKGTTAEWSYIAPVSETGRASVTITDNGSATVEGVDTVTATVQRAATSGGGFVAEPNSSADTFNITYETDLDGISATALVSNNGVELANGTAVFPVKLEAKSLVDIDTRFGDEDPKYSDLNEFDNKTDTTADGLLRVFGTVTSTTNAGVSGVAVELSGEGLNFANANTSAGATLMLNDSIVLVTDANGAYEAFVRSSVSGKQTISVDAQGATASVDVTFEGSTGNADSMTLDLASSVVDGRTADVKATVVDAFDNPVAGVTVTFKEEGPGYLNSASGTTDAEGEVIVNLITLRGDTGTSTISATATLDGVSTTESDTITVGTVTSAEQKVNAGSFKGFVALYAKGYEGQRMSAIVAGKWLQVDSLASNFERVVRFTGAGYDIKVRIYIDGVQVGDEFDITTK